MPIRQARKRLRGRQGARSKEAAMGALAEALGRFLAPIVIPLIKQALREFFRDSAEIAQPNKELQDEADRAFAGLRGITRVPAIVRDASDHPASGDGGDS
jgi:hypothetical protein